MDALVEEHEVRLAAGSAWTAISGRTTSSAHCHPQCRAVVLLEDGTYVEGAVNDILWPDYIFNYHLLSVQSVRLSSVGKNSCSHVHVNIGDGEYTGFFVFLKEQDAPTSDLTVVWRCISLALGPRIEEPIRPKSFEEVTSITWDGYCRANRACDGDLMSEYFHASCRLTYTNPSDQIVMYNPQEFFEKVSSRYEKEPLHQPYAHLKDSPLLDKIDTLLSIEFSSSQIAMVILKICHPPFLWTDFLTCARISEEGRKPQWWIMHKSSDNEPHPLSGMAEER